jgi:hypothetical protein
LSRFAESATPVLDIRTCKLVPGGGDAFEHLFCDGALPLLKRLCIHVVGYGRSLDNDDVYYLMRSFPSTSKREALLDAFYGSDQWKQQYRETALALIDTYYTIVIPLTRYFGAEVMSAALLDQGR